MTRDSYRFDLVMALFAALLVAAAMWGGCCTNAGSSATCARKWVAGAYSAIGVAASVQTACDHTAVGLAEAGNDAAAKDAIGKCQVLNKTLHTAQDTTVAISQGVDTGEKLGQKDFTAAIAPGEAAICSLNRAVADVDPKAPLYACMPGGE